MRMTKLKDVTQLGVFSNVVDLQVVDGNTEAVVVKLFGQELRITVAGTYSSYLSLSIPEPKKEVEKYRVKGSYMGVDIVPKVFESEYDANNFVIEMNNKLSYDGEHTLEVEKYTEYEDGTKI